MRTTSGFAFNCVRQGKAIVEPQDGGGFLILLPDASVCFAATREIAQQTLKRWAKRNLHGVPNAVGVLRVEWR